MKGRGGGGGWGGFGKMEAQAYRSVALKSGGAEHLSEAGLIGLEKLEGGGRGGADLKPGPPARLLGEADADRPEMGGLERKGEARFPRIASAEGDEGLPNLKGGGRGGGGGRRGSRGRGRGRRRWGRLEGGCEGGKGEGTEGWGGFSAGGGGRGGGGEDTGGGGGGGGGGESGGKLRSGKGGGGLFGRIPSCPAADVRPFLVPGPLPPSRGPRGTSGAMGFRDGGEGG